MHIGHHSDSDSKLTLVSEKLIHLKKLKETEVCLQQVDNYNFHFHLKLFCIKHITKSRHELPFPVPSLGLFTQFRPLFNDIDGTDEPISKLFVSNWRLIITTAIYIL